MEETVPRLSPHQPARTHLPEELDGGAGVGVAAAVLGVRLQVIHLHAATLAPRQQLVDFARVEEAQPCGRDHLHAFEVVSADWQASAWEVKRGW